MFLVEIVQWFYLVFIKSKNFHRDSDICSTRWLNKLRRFFVWGDIKVKWCKYNMNLNKKKFQNSTQRVHTNSYAQKYLKNPGSRIGCTLFPKSNQFNARLRPTYSENLMWICAVVLLVILLTNHHIISLAEVKIASLRRQELQPAGTAKWPTTLRFGKILGTTVLRSTENPQDVLQKIHRPWFLTSHIISFQIL